jgi:curli biogenesis system outer membrane secretion channel CsgG
MEVDNMKKYNFDIQDMLSIALVLVVTGLAIAFGLNVMGDVKSDMTADSTEANATQKAIETAVLKLINDGIEKGYWNFQEK